MKTQTLNEKLRKIILERLVASRFGERQKALHCCFQDLGDAVYERVYPKDVLRTMARLPDGFFESCDLIRAMFGGDVYDVPLSMERPFAAKHLGSAIAAQFSSEHHLTEVYDNLRDDQRKLTQEIDNARSHARGLIWNSYTVRQLLERWPECGPFVKDLVTSDTSRALAIPVADLNRMFGLPQKD